jgi:hypothetical protein
MLQVGVAGIKIGRIIECLRIGMFVYIAFER